jgi:hypothetical protein
LINFLALLSALAISVVAGYFSIIGLTVIFAGAFWPVIIMGSVLEVGKLVTASWLYRNWHLTSGFIKAYLTAAVALLMLITSMGIFGFLSKAHIEQQLLMSTGDAEQVEILDSKIQYQQEQIDDVDKQVAQIDGNIAKMTEKGQTKSSLQAIKQQKTVRDELISKKDVLIEEMSQLKTEKITAESRVKKLEAEVGPLKYIAALIYDEADTNTLEKAVRLVIILLVLVFDPLAVVLLIAANIGLAPRASTKNSKPTKKKYTSKKKQNTIEIDKSQIANLSKI